MGLKITGLPSARRAMLMLAMLAMLSPANQIGRAVAAEAVDSAPVTIGETLTIASQVMQQERRVTVFLPLGYNADPEARYPVLYLIDGGLEQDYLHIAGTTVLNALWGRSQPVIVIGIETLDRRSELTGETTDPDLLKAYPTAGHARRFRRFVRDEVMPLVARRFRTTDVRGVIGESLAGLFIVDSALADPGLFQRHAAISPSLWWDRESLSKRAATMLDGPDGVPMLYLTIANEGDEMQQAYDRLVAALAAQEKPGARWCSEPRLDLTHATIYHSLSPRALQFLFPIPSADAPIEGFEPPCSGASTPTHHVPIG